MNLKKKYMKPEMEAYKMEAINMVCESPGIGSGGASGSGTLAPQMPDFFEEDDFITWEE